MKNFASLSLFALLTTVPVFAQQSVTITFPSSLSCTTDGSTTSTFAVTSAAFSVTETIATAGAGASRTAFSAYEVKKIPDACSGPLFTQLLSGAEIAGNVVITYSDTIAGKVTPVLTVTLSKVFITELDLKSADSETYYFSFGQIKLSNGSVVSTGT